MRFSYRGVTSSPSLLSFLDVSSCEREPLSELDCGAGSGCLGFDAGFGPRSANRCFWSVAPVQCLIDDDVLVKRDSEQITLATKDCRMTFYLQIEVSQIPAKQSRKLLFLSIDVTVTTEGSNDIWEREVHAACIWVIRIICCKQGHDQQK